MNNTNSKVIFITRDINSVGGIQKITSQLEKTLNNSNQPSEIYSFRNNNKLTILSLLKDTIKAYSLIANKSNTHFVYNITGFEILIFSFISLIFKKKIYYWEHGNPNIYKKTFSIKILQKYFYKRAKNIIVLHDAFKRESPNINYITIPNQCPQLTLPTPHLNLPIKILWVGRNSPEKQPELAYEALTLHAKKESSIDHYFITPMHLEHSMISDIKNLKIINGNDFFYSEWLDINSILLITSTQEAMPGVIFEALSMGAKIVTTNCSPWINEIKSTCDIDIIDSNASPEVICRTIDAAILNKTTCTNKNAIGILLEQFNESNITKKWKSIM